MIKYFCNICGTGHIEDDLVALITEEIDSSVDIIEDAVCPECCNKIKEFIVSLKKENGIEGSKDYDHNMCSLNNQLQVSPDLTGQPIRVKFMEEGK